MAVVVDDKLFAHSLAPDHEPGWTIRAESDDGADDLVGLDARADERRGRECASIRECRDRQAFGGTARQREACDAETRLDEPLAAGVDPLQGPDYSDSGV